MEEASIKAGMTLDAEQQVTPELSAPHVGSGALRVYATPSMAMFIEQSCRKLVDHLLPDGKTTVGFEINVRHSAPTPVGMRVYARVEVTSMDGALISFHVQLRDDFEAIGEAEHRRAIVDSDRILKRVEAKSKQGDEELPGVASG
jgi:fluoroacetyl-CoA thioesterase